MTRTPLSRSKGQRSRSPGCFAHRRVGASGGYAAVDVGTCWPWETAVTLPSARRRKALRRPRGRRGAEAYRGGLPYSLFAHQTLQADAIIKGHEQDKKAQSAIAFALIQHKTANIDSLRNYKTHFILKIHQNTTNYSYIVDVSASIRNLHRRKKLVLVLPVLDTPKTNQMNHFIDMKLIPKNISTRFPLHHQWKYESVVSR